MRGLCRKACGFDPHLGYMKLKELLKSLSKPAINGFIDTSLSDGREVIVQVFKGWDEESGFGKYEYHSVRTSGVLFFDGEFKHVIAAEPYDGIDESA